MAPRVRRHGARTARARGRAETRSRRSMSLPVIEVGALRPRKRPPVRQLSNGFGAGVVERTTWRGAWNGEPAEMAASLECCSASDRIFAPHAASSFAFDDQ